MGSGGAMVLGLLWAMVAAAGPPKRDLGSEPVVVPSFAAELGTCRQRAVFFGVSHYDANPAIRDLKTPAKDVRRIAKILERRYGFVPEIHLDPTREDIVDRLYELGGELQACDSLVVYYAGHGKRGHWLPRDAKPDRPSTWVATSLVTDTLREVPARQVLLVVDACFAGAKEWRSTRGLPENNTQVEIRKLKERPSRKVLMSGGDELVLDFYKKGHSVFAYFLAQELESLQAPYTTAGLLLGKVAPLVSVNAGQVPQGGLLAGDEGGYFVLATVGDSPPPPPQASVEMVRIPGGRFTMGSPPGEAGHRDDEGPQHEVTLDAFFVTKSEITQGLWTEVMGNNPSGFPHCGPTCPVENVTWYDAVAFANRLSLRDGLSRAYRIDGTSVTWDPDVNGYRLLTEAEWEYAARGGEPYVYAGSAEATVVGWIEDNSGGRTHPVCAKTQNGFGLCDMTGNVWEWVWDWDAPYPEQAEPNPTGPQSGSNRVRRGGSWDNTAPSVRVAIRSWSASGRRNLGFRLATSNP